ncbi:hypothetical protein [Rhodococcus kronopolitis]|uniref:Uncharacterized protein n=1 Tax=Rhodococcus kronopolitis TaxID=1460226 RepID=A0ABV9FSH1_9NOCA
MSDDPVQESIEHLIEKREEVALHIRELQGQLDVSSRALGEISREIESLQRVRHELLKRHPELRGGGVIAS